MQTYVFTARRYTSAIYAVVVCPSVCLSVCLSVTSWYCIETTGRIGLGFLWLFAEKIRVPRKNNGTTRGNFAQNFENFAMISRARCPQNSSTVELVDDTYTTIDESWQFTTSLPQPTAEFMTHVTCRLTAKNRDQLRNPTIGNRVWATFFTH